MCADKLGPVARGLVVDGVGSRVLVGSSCHLHRQHVDLYSPRRTPLVLSNFSCFYPYVLCVSKRHTSGRVRGSPPADFLDFITLGQMLKPPS